MLNNIKQFFILTNRERRGVLLLTALIIIAVLAPFTYPYLLTDESVDFSNLQQDIDRYKQQILENEKAKKAKPNYRQTNEPTAGQIANIQLAPFNPNELTAAKAMQLGLPEKVANNIEKYLSKGGKFKKPEDFKKLYGLTDADYQRLLPYMIFETQGKTTEMVATEQPSGAKTTIRLFSFDPNTITHEQALELGLPEKIAKNIINYRNKGGKFKKPEDFKKLYGLTETDYNRLLPYITIEPGLIASGKTDERVEKMEFTTFDNDAPIDKSAQKKFTIDINTATPADWDKLRGIGETYANMIVNYRTKLGGFTHVEQVKEVRGLPPEVYDQIAPFLINQNPTAIKTIHLNTADELTLSKHPYIDKLVAQSLVNMRLQHGHFKSVSDIKKSKLVDETLYQKIAPYLHVD